MKNESDTLLLVNFILSISTIISSLEWISLHKYLRDDHFFGWKMRTYRQKMFLKSPTENIFRFLFKYPTILYLYGVQTIVGLSIFISFIFQLKDQFLIECGIMAFLSILLSVRGNEGSMGSDQLTKMIYVVSFIAYLIDTPFMLQVSLIFISCFLLLAYLTSGWLRIFQKGWRSGADLLVVLRQHTYGKKWAWSIGKNNPHLIRMVSMTVLIFECSIIIAPFLPPALLFPYLIFGISFHFMNALIMGLNTFFWSFLSAYPALIWLSLKI